MDLGGELHALTPMQLAFPKLLHVFNQPTLFQNALWLPYRRDHAYIRSAISAAKQLQGNKHSSDFHQGDPSAVNFEAIFAHADVQTAR